MYIYIYFIFCYRVCESIKEWECIYLFLISIEFDIDYKREGECLKGFERFLLIFEEMFLYRDFGESEIFVRVGLIKVKM